MFFVKKYLLVLYAILCVIVFSCKKEKDDTGPRIVFNSPVENQSYNVFDYVIVNATVTDDKTIASVNINLLDYQHNAVHSTMAVNVSSSPSFTFNVAYYLDNIHLETGAYFLQITASDGKNDSRKVQPIFITEAPKVLKSTFVVTKPNSTTTVINKLDTVANNLIPYRTFSGDYLSSAANSYYQYYYNCGSVNGAFAGVDLTYDLVKFTINPVVTGQPYFTGFYPVQKTNYVALKTGYIRGYDYNGNIVYGANAVSGNYAKQMISNTNYLISEQNDLTTGAGILVTYYPTGAIQQQVALNQNVIAMYEKDYANVFVFGNSVGQGLFQLFDRENNYLWNPYPSPLATGTILSVAQISSTVYLIAHSNGTIYKYQYQTTSVTPYLAGYTALQLKYDDVNNHVYIVEDTKITVVNYSSLSVVKTILSSDSIKSVDLLFNR